VCRFLRLVRGHRAACTRRNTAVVAVLDVGMHNWRIHFSVETFSYTDGEFDCCRRNNARKRHSTRASAANTVPPNRERNLNYPLRRRAHSPQEERQKIPRRNMNVIPCVLRHRFHYSIPGIHLAQREGSDILEAQRDHECGMTQRLHLVDFPAATRRQARQSE